MSLEQLRHVLEAPGDWKVFGRNSMSGTHAWVRSRILHGAEFGHPVRELPGPQGVVRAVATTSHSLGYASRDAVHGEVRILDLVDSASAPVRLLRPVFLACSPSDPSSSRFAGYVLTPDGQARLENCGLIPLARKPRP